MGPSEAAKQAPPQTLIRGQQGTETGRYHAPCSMCKTTIVARYEGGPMATCLAMHARVILVTLAD